VHAARAFAENGVGAQLIREKHKQVGFTRKFRRLRLKTSRNYNASRAKRGSANEMTARKLRLHGN